MTQSLLGVWRPWTPRELVALRNPAQQYGLGEPVEIRTLADIEALTVDRVLVSLEMDTHAVPLARFTHPDGPALYLVGPLNGSLPLEVLDMGQIVQVESTSLFPLRPEIAAGIVLHDRHINQAKVPA